MDFGLNVSRAKTKFLEFRIENEVGANKTVLVV